MKWLSINTREQEQIYELWNSMERLLTLAYHPGSGTLRISADNEKRVFLIGREGFLRRRTVLRNEYGVRMGQLTYDGNQDNQGTIDIYEEGFTYVLQNDQASTAFIYRNAEIVATSEFPAISDDINSDNYDLLMVILCWYISTAVRRRVVEYA